MTYNLPNEVLRRITAILCRESPRFTPYRKILRELDQRVTALLIAVGSYRSKDASVAEVEYLTAYREAVEALTS